MSNRLKSFHGPSTPTQSPQTPQPPSSPSRQTESTFHRKTRTLLQDLRSVAQTWDDLVLVDGLKAARELTDTRTDLDNALKLIPDRRPRTHLVRPNLAVMDGCLSKLDTILLKLRKQFQRMNSIIDNLEAVLIEAHKVKGWKWVSEEPLWITWSLEKFVTRIPAILPAYHRSLALHVELVDKLRSHSVTFEESRDAINQWAQQPWIEEEGWDPTWEDLCAVEVDRCSTVLESFRLAHILEKNPDDVVITFAKRTAFGKAKRGQLKDASVDEMLYALLKATFRGIKLDPSKIDDICVGTCHPPSPLYVSRAAAIAAGIPYQVPISVVNRLCSSGLMAIRHIAHAIKVGEASLGLAIGVESMSLNPRPTPKVSLDIAEDTHAHDCLQDMGWTSEMVAQQYQVSRQKQDEYAYISHTKAAKAQSSGIFAEEIIPIELNGTVVSADDTIRPGVTMEGLTALKPVFPLWGNASTTAGNASSIGDGAGICILSSRAKAQEEGMDIIGKYVASTVVGVEPRYMGISPIYAIRRILFQLGLTKEDVDVFEINEAFASQFAYCVEELEIPMKKINPNGGAIAISHPLGTTGIRQVVTGLAELKRQNKNILCTSMCIGSGMGAAGIFVNEATH